MQDFPVYFELGYEHILDPNGLDHILFVIAMIIIYKYDDWKNILFIITSFTIAHSITLILSAFDFLNINQSFVEAFIAFTILFTALENIFFKKLIKHRVLLSGFFGLIHGLGFSNYFKALVPADFSVFDILLAFNIGIEAGQLIIVLITLVVLFLLSNIKQLKKVYIINTVSAIIALQSLFWFIERVF